MNIDKLMDSVKKVSHITDIYSKAIRGSMVARTPEARARLMKAMQILSFYDCEELIKDSHIMIHKKASFWSKLKVLFQV